MLGARAVIHAQPRRPFPSKGPREAKGGGLPDRHRGNLCVAAGRRCRGACDPWPDQRTDTMPTNKDFKRLVRARMQKTGEAYTAARAHLLQKKDRKSTRLNSSHEWISYAVFCLKRKHTTTDRHRSKEKHA